jgi:outer membrane receptor protein involved in Fe transport
MIRRVTGFGALLVLPVTWVTAAAADPDDKTTNILQEVVVSATRQGNQSMQDVPMAISVIDPNALAATGAAGMTEFARDVPSLAVLERGPGQNQIDLRGIATGYTDIYNTMEERPLVAYYLDDTPLAVQGFTPDLKIYDLERVEVLRGPQGTLYGASAMAGTILLVTKKPSSTDFYGSSEFVTSNTEGGGENYGVRGSVNVPLSPGLAGLLVTAYNGRNSGYIDNVELHSNDINWDRSTQARAALRLTPTSSLTVDVSMLFEKLDTGGSNFSFSQLGVDKYASLTEEPIGDDLKTYNITVHDDLDWANLISSTSYTDRKISFSETGEYLTEAYYLPPPLMAGPYLNDNKVQDFTQEIRLTSRQDQKLRWTAGAYYDHISRTNYQNLDAPGFDAREGALIGDPTFSSLQYGGFSANSWFSGFQQVAEHQSAIFGELTYSPIKALDLTAGLRGFWWQQQYSLYFGGSAGALGPGEPNTTLQGTKENGVNPRFVADYHITDDVLVYAEAAKGFRFGGVNQPVPEAFCGSALKQEGITSAPLTYGSDSLWSYSIGEKSMLDGGKVRLNATAFLIDWSNVQTLNELSCSYAFFQNADKVQSTGVELEMSARVTSALTARINGSYTHAVADGAIPNIDAASGNHVPYFPQYLGSVGADYIVPMVNSDVKISADYQYHGSSGTQFNPTNPLYRVVPSYVNVDMAITYETDRWQAGIFARNLTNTNQVTLIAPDALGDEPGDQVAYARPRTVGARVNFKF